MDPRAPGLPAQAALLVSTCADNARSEAKIRRFSSLSERSWKP
jgi:hypothetical protein